jgi:hypothetical protein
MLGHLASRRRFGRLRLGIGVTDASRRHPAVTAQAAATLAPMGREERVEHDGYNEQEPADVADQLGHAATLFNNVLARLSADDWHRTTVYNYPKANERSLRWVAVHTVHDVQHHLLDIRRQVS